MCHTSLHYYVHCGHTNVHFIQCSEIQPRGRHQATANTKWRHKSPAGVAHAYPRPCPICLRFESVGGEKEAEREAVNTWREFAGLARTLPRSRDASPLREVSGENTPRPADQPSGEESSPSRESSQSTSEESADSQVPRLATITAQPTHWPESTHQGTLFQTANGTYYHPLSQSLQSQPIPRLQTRPAFPSAEANEVARFLARQEPNQREVEEDEARAWQAAVNEFPHQTVAADHWARNLFGGIQPRPRQAFFELDHYRQRLVRQGYVPDWITLRRESIMVDIMMLHDQALLGRPPGQYAHGGPETSPPLRDYAGIGNTEEGYSAAEEVAGIPTMSNFRTAHQQALDSVMHPIETRNLAADNIPIIRANLMHLCDTANLWVRNPEELAELRRALLIYRQVIVSVVHFQSRLAQQGADNTESEDSSEDRGTELEESSEPARQEHLVPIAVKAGGATKPAPESAREQKKLLCNNPMHKAMPQHEDTRRLLLDFDEVASALQAKKSESPSTDTIEYLIYFDACKHLNAIFLEKIVCGTYKDHCGGKPTERPVTQCGCYDFSIDLAGNRYGESLGECLLCADGDMVGMDRSARMVAGKREIELWPEKAREGGAEAREMR